MCTYTHTHSVSLQWWLSYINTSWKNFLYSRCAYEEEFTHRNITHCPPPPPKKKDYLTKKKRKYVVSQVFVSSSFVSRSATCKHWILDHLSYYSIVKNITRFSTRQVDIRLSVMLWHVLTSHCEDRLCVPVTHTHIKSHISSQAFKWGDNISAYYSRMSFQEVKVILLLTNSEQYMVKSIPREIYFFPKAAKYIQRKTDILLISTIQEMI